MYIVQPTIKLLEKKRKKYETLKNLLKNEKKKI